MVSMVRSALVSACSRAQVVMATTMTPRWQAHASVRPWIRGCWAFRAVTRRAWNRGGRSQALTARQALEHVHGSMPVITILCASSMGLTPCNVRSCPHSGTVRAGPTAQAR
jgi:hypothetical protein